MSQLGGTAFKLCSCARWLPCRTARHGGPGTAPPCQAPTCHKADVRKHRRKLATHVRQHVERLLRQVVPPAVLLGAFMQWSVAAKRGSRWAGACWQAAGARQCKAMTTCGRAPPTLKMPAQRNRMLASRPAHIPPTLVPAFGARRQPAVHRRHQQQVVALLPCRDGAAARGGQRGAGALRCVCLRAAGVGRLVAARGKGAS